MENLFLFPVDLEITQFYHAKRVQVIYSCVCSLPQEAGGENTPGASERFLLCGCTLKNQSQFPEL